MEITQNDLLTAQRMARICDGIRLPMADQPDTTYSFMAGQLAGAGVRSELGTFCALMRQVIEASGIELDPNVTVAEALKHA